MITGVLLVLGSVLIGAKVVASADSSTSVWAASHDLGPGTVIAGSDVHQVKVRVPSGVYVPGSSGLDQLVGKSVLRALGDGELIPAAALGSPEPGTRVTIPFDARSAPDLARGQRISVWLSTKTCAAVLLLRDVAVQDVSEAGGGAFSRGSGQTVVVRVDPDSAQRVATALAFDGAQLRAGVLDGPAAPSAEPLPALTGCAAK